MENHDADIGLPQNVPKWFRAFWWIFAKDSSTTRQWYQTSCGRFFIQHSKFQQSRGFAGCTSRSLALYFHDGQWSSPSRFIIIGQAPWKMRCSFTLLSFLLRSFSDLTVPDSSRQFHGLYKRDAASMRFSIHEIHEITALPNTSTTWSTWGPGASDMVRSWVCYHEVLKNW